MTGRWRLSISVFLLAVVTLSLVVLSLRPFTFSSHFIPYQDKVGHFCAYALTAWLACLAFSARLSRPLVAAFVYATVIGGILELLQAYMTTTRQGEWADLLANLLGALVGCVVFRLWRRAVSPHACHEPE